MKPIRILELVATIIGVVLLITIVFPAIIMLSPLIIICGILDNL